MFVAKKFAALGAAAAISATGLVAATGVSANAATGTPTYSCSYQGADKSGTFDVPLDFAIPSPVTGDTIKAGTPVSGSASLADLAAKAQGGDPVLGAFLKTLSGAEGGNPEAETSLKENGLTVTPGDFEVLAAGLIKLPFSLQAQTYPGAELPALLKTLALPVKASFTADQAVDFPAGTYNLNLPDTFSLGLKSGDMQLGSIECNGTAQVAKLVVRPAQSTGGSDSGTTADLQKAQHKLKQDQAKLKHLKKAAKKAKGHKKAVLKKKIAKLNKTIKADKAAVAAAK